MNHEKLIDELVRDEGLRLRIYPDTKGIPTIGIGRNLLKGISREEAYHLANNDIEDASADLDRAIPWWSKLDEVRQRALVNLCFNMGIARLLGFHKMLAALQSADFAAAARELLDSTWKIDVGPERSGRIHEMILNGGAA